MSPRACAGGVHGPVVGASGLFTHGRVFLISDQPVKFGVGPQAQGPPASGGDVAAAGVEVAQDHHVLGVLKRSNKRTTVPSAETAHEKEKAGKCWFDLHRPSTSSGCL